MVSVLYCHCYDEIWKAKTDCALSPSATMEVYYHVRHSFFKGKAHSNGLRKMQSYHSCHPCKLPCLLILSLWASKHSLMPFSFPFFIMMSLFVSLLLFAFMYLTSMSVFSFCSRFTDIPIWLPTASTISTQGNCGRPHYSLQSRKQSCLQICLTLIIDCKEFIPPQKFTELFFFLNCLLFLPQFYLCFSFIKVNLNYFLSTNSLNGNAFFGSGGTGMTLHRISCRKCLDWW